MLQNLTFHPAEPRTSRYELAELIYGTDPYLYPYWFRSPAEAISPLAAMIDNSTSPYYWQNIFVATRHSDERVVGLVVALGASSQLQAPARSGSDAHNYVLEHYLMPLVQHARAVDSTTLEISNVCVAEKVRGFGIGKQLLSQALAYYRDQGFRHFKLDCLADNTVALKLYQGMGFRIYHRGLGFAAPNTQRPAVVSLFLET